MADFTAAESLLLDYNGDPRVPSKQAAHSLWTGQICVKGNSRQDHFGAKYGETGTPAFAIINVSASSTLSWSGTDITIRLGVDNILDKYYTTFADWNKIPQKGRNVYANIDVTL